ncbi:acyltransferase family protein, partial [Ventosimonas gracilis]|uniref:acyltransferase family protein n=1 Tax=Ventosimonas gracilis TaxID=1680762 RepID=UPI000A6D87C4
FERLKYLFLPVISGSYHAIKTCLLPKTLILIVFGMMLLMQGEKRASYFSLIIRTPEFLIGVLLALGGIPLKIIKNNRIFGKIYLQKWRTLAQGLGFIFIACSFIFMTEGSNFPGLLFLIPCLGTALVISGYGGRFTSFLSATPMIWIGGLSYSLYLWHWPVLAFFRYVFENYILSFDILLLAILLILFLSYISEKWIEIPFRKKQLSSRSFFRNIILACLPLMIANRVNAAIEKPLPLEETRYANPATICHGHQFGDCIRGQRDSESKPILVLGDSHAAQLNLFFDKVGEKTNQRFRVVTASSCVTIPGFDIERIPDYARADCASSIKYISHFLSDASVIVVAGMWQYQMQSQGFRDALERFLKDCEAHKKQVIVLWQIPMLSSDVLRLRRLEKLGLRRDPSLNQDWKNANQAVQNIVARYPSTQFWEFMNLGIFATPPIYQGSLIYHDNHHLNEKGSALYGSTVADMFVKIKN